MQFHLQARLQKSEERIYNQHIEWNEEVDDDTMYLEGADLDRS